MNSIRLDRLFVGKCSWPTRAALRAICLEVIAIFAVAVSVAACSPDPTAEPSPSDGDFETFPEPADAGCTAALVDWSPEVETGDWTPLPFDPPTIRFDADSEPFAGFVPPPDTTEAFTAVAADMDLDGDADVLFNRHLFAPLELFENDNGRFVQLNRGKDVISGLWDNPGIPELYVDGDEMNAAIADSGLSGVFIWHDASRGGMWRLRGEGADTMLLIEVDRPLLAFTDIDPSLVLQRDSYTAEVTLPAGQYFGINNELTGTQLKVTVMTAPVPTLYIGGTLVPNTSGEVSLWKNDPHGLTWVNVMGSPEPDIFVTRGGLTGLLLPPFDGKVDYLYEFTGGLPLYQQVGTNVLGPEYCRGRQIAWYDLDNDGAEELFVSCTLTPNQYLDKVDGSYLDRAPVLGLDLIDGDAFAVLDLNGDACLDLVQNDEEALIVNLHDGDTFIRQSGSVWGLDSPVHPEDLPAGIWNPFALNTFDFDRDGDLDLWASAFRGGAEVAVFRRDGDRFVDATADLGLEDAIGFSVLIPTDVDNDGWIDVIAGSSASTVVWHNLEGKSFEALDLGVPIWMGIPVDVNGDGRVDIVASIGEEHFVLFNHTDGAGRLVTVDVDAPLGSLVRGYYADGSVLVQQWGSADNNRYSQGLLPLRFGVGKVPLVSVGLQRPGELGERKRAHVAEGQEYVQL